MTAVVLALLGLAAASIVGLGGSNVERHVSIGIFSTMVALLAHSMMMFYLVGKGKAVRDAMVEHGLAGDQDRRIATVRKPVFAVATLAMSATMVAAILGASVDTGVLPPAIHALVAYAAIGGNVAALCTEALALTTASGIVDEVNRLIGP